MAILKKYFCFFIKFKLVLENEKDLFINPNNI